jgi:hypothetical protein
MATDSLGNSSLLLLARAGMARGMKRFETGRMRGPVAGCTPGQTHHNRNAVPICRVAEGT